MKMKKKQVVIFTNKMAGSQVKVTTDEEQCCDKNEQK